MSPRAARRLEMARLLMNWPEGCDVMAKINELPAEKRDSLKGNVDWLESYETEEARMWPEKWGHHEA